MIGVIFWSGTGNTERMAYEVAEGIKAAGQEVEVKSVSEVSVDEAAAYEKLALGCADMGAEQLEEGEFEPFYTELEGKLSGKKIAILAPMVGVVLGWKTGALELKMLVAN